MIRDPCMKLRSEVLRMIADLIAAVGRQRMLDRPQIGDVVLIDSLWPWWGFFQAEIAAIAGREVNAYGCDASHYQVRPLWGILRHRRWIYAWQIEGIVSRAADRQRQQECRELEKLL